MHFVVGYLEQWTFRPSNQDTFQNCSKSTLECVLLPSRGKHPSQFFLASSWSNLQQGPDANSFSNITGCPKKTASRQKRPPIWNGPEKKKKTPRYFHVVIPFSRWWPACKVHLFRAAKASRWAKPTVCEAQNGAWKHATWRCHSDFLKGLTWKHGKAVIHALEVQGYVCCFWSLCFKTVDKKMALLLACCSRVKHICSFLGLFGWWWWWWWRRGRSALPHPFHVGSKVALLLGVASQKRRRSDLKVLHDFFADDHQSFSLPSDFLEWQSSIVGLSWPLWHAEVSTWIRKHVFCFQSENAKKNVPSWITELLRCHWPLRVAPHRPGDEG